MTLDEAIEHAEKRATTGMCNDRCKQDHAQLAEWLKELRDIRKIWNNIIIAYEGICKKYNESDDNYIATINYLYGRVAHVEEENTRLRELINLMDERSVLLPCMTNCNPHDCRFYGNYICEHIDTLMDNLGFEVK